MNAIISGRAEIALWEENGTLYRLPWGVEQPVECAPAPLAFYFGDATDLQFVPNLTLDETRRKLDEAVNCADALHLALMALDGELSFQLRLETSDTLNELMADHVVRDYVRGVLFARPLTADADIEGALKAARAAEAELLFDFWMDFKDKLLVIQKVWLAWNAIPTEIFRSTSEQSEVRITFVQAGLFSTLVDAYVIDAIPKFLHEIDSNLLLRPRKYVCHIWTDLLKKQDSNDKLTNASTEIQRKSLFESLAQRFIALLASCRQFTKDNPMVRLYSRRLVPYLLIACLMTFIGQQAQIILSALSPQVTFVVLWVGLTYSGIMCYEYYRTRTVLARFLGRVSASILSKPNSKFEEEVATALFCDLRNFSTVLERILPYQLENLICDYTSATTNIVHRHGGQVIDYFGDGIFVLFRDSKQKRGRDTQKDHALRSARAAIEMEEVVSKLAENLEKLYGVQLHISIGINTGPMMIGIIGSNTSLKLGAVGNTVNVAARVQGFSQVCGFSIVATKESCELIDDSIPRTPCGQFNLKGLDLPVELYGIGTPIEVTSNELIQQPTDAKSQAQELSASAKSNKGSLSQKYRADVRSTLRLLAIGSLDAHQAENLLLEDYEETLSNVHS